jgi:hypothetical protein
MYNKSKAEPLIISSAVQQYKFRPQNLVGFKKLCLDRTAQDWLPPVE